MTTIKITDLKTDEVQTLETTEQTKIVGGHGWASVPELPKSSQVGPIWMVKNI